MSVTASTMKCPLCEEQLLDTVSSAVGSWNHCPNCGGIFIQQELLAELSLDRAKCEEALAETKSLLLPTERWCPKCLQKLFDGRVSSRGVIFSLCVACQSIWTDPPTLKKFDEIVEKTIRSQAGFAAANRGAESGSKSAHETNLYEDSGLGGFFRSVARFSDHWADRFSKPAPAASSKKSKPVMIREAEPIAPPAASPTPAPVPPAPKEPEQMPPPPVIDIPEFIFPEEPSVPKEPVVEEKQIPPPVVAPVIVQTPEPEKPKPLPEPKPEPEPEKPKLVSAPEKTIPKALDLPQPKAAVGFGQKLAALFNPKPRPRTVKPIKVASPVKAPPPAKPIELPKPVQPVKPAPVPVAKISKPKGPGFFSSMMGSLKPRPKPATATPIPPVKVETPKPPPVVKAVPAPKPARPAPTPKPKRVKVPTDPVDHIALWSPWVLALVGVIGSSFRDFGFEMGPAFLWGLSGWSIGTMIQLVRMYRAPVTLTGQVVLADEQQPKGEVVFKTEDKTILLNPLGRWDVIPRLFGLSNPRQLLKGEVTLTGWYRGELIPSLEVQEIRTEKAVRKSMVRSLRWAAAILILLLAVIISLSLD